jgi:hypothetical protein
MQWDCANDRRVLKTLRETLLWQALKHGKREDTFPGIRNMQRAIMPLMRSSFYFRSEVVAVRKRNGGTDKVRVVVTSKLAILDRCTAPIFDALFSLHSNASTASSPYFLFDDIENTPIVRHIKSVVDSSSFILVDTNEEKDAAPFPKLPVSARLGCCIKVQFISSIEVDCALGSEIGANVQAGSKVQLALFTKWFLNMAALGGLGREFSDRTA